jgi:hypothetical protein
VLVCDDLWGNCDTSDTNGCETALDSQTANCGGCGVRCSAANATSTCAQGSCHIGMCNAGYADIDGVATNGCECHLDSNPTSCTTASTAISVAVGGTHTSSGIIATAGTSEWFQIAFQAGGHPRVHFATNPGGTHRIDVQDVCLSTVSPCADRTAGAGGVTDWEFFDTTGMTGTRMTPAPATVFVRVSNTGAPVCTSYSLAISN